MGFVCVNLITGFIKMNFEQEKAAVLKITWTKDVDSFRRTVIPNSNFCWEVCREHFPKEHQPGIPSIVGKHFLTFNFQPLL